MRRFSHSVSDHPFFSILDPGPLFLDPQACVGVDNEPELNGWGEISMKAMLNLLDGQPTTVQDKPSRLLPSPLPQQKEEKEVQAEIPAGTGKAVEEEEEKGVSIEREPLRPSPQSEFRQVI